MKRSDLARILTMASLVGDDVLVIGSQSILGSYSEDLLPDAAVGSIEADVAFLNDPDARKADLLDAGIGELSAFHAQFGIYGQGVEVKTATLPAGWEDRTVEVRIDHDHTARCLDPHDLAISKLIAGRQKDLDFA